MIYHEDEKLIRDFLIAGMGEFWCTLPYDWMELPIEYLDDCCLFDTYDGIPDKVAEAYERTRADPEHTDYFSDGYRRSLEAVWWSIHPRDAQQQDG